MSYKSSFSELLGVNLSCRAGPQPYRGSATSCAVPWCDKILPGAEGSSWSVAMPWAPPQPFAMCPRGETPAKTLWCSCTTLPCREGGWGNEEQPHILPWTGLGLHCPTEGLFFFRPDWVVAMGARHENTTRLGPGTAGPLAQDPVRTQQGRLEVSLSSASASPPSTPLPSQGAFNPFG